MTGHDPSASHGTRLPKSRKPAEPLFLLCVGLLISAVLSPVRADQVFLRNGDCLYGRVLSLTTNSLILQNDVLGRVTLPRAQVLQVALGSKAQTNMVPQALVTTGSSTRASATLTNLEPDLRSVLRQLGASTNLLPQAQADLLAAAGPDAQNKFRELLGGLLSGRLNLDDLRKQARSAADQLRELKRDLGPEVGDSLDGYLAILDNFLGETAPSNGSKQATPTAQKREPGAARKN